MSYGIEIDNVEGKTLITDKITNHFIHSTGSIYNDYSGLGPRYPYPPPNALESDLILLHPIPQTQINTTDNTRIWVCQDYYNSTTQELSYNISGGLADRYDYAIVRDFFNTQVSPSGYGLSVFASNGNCTYWSGFKNSNVEIVATAEFLSSDSIELPAYLGPIEDDYNAGLISEDEYHAAIQTNVYGSKIIFQFDSLDDIYCAASSTYAFTYSSVAEATVGYIFDFENNTVECVRATLPFSINEGDLPFDVNGTPDYTAVNYLAATYGIYKLRGID